SAANASPAAVPSLDQSSSARLMHPAGGEVDGCSRTLGDTPHRARAQAHRGAGRAARRRSGPGLRRRHVRVTGSAALGRGRAAHGQPRAPCAHAARRCRLARGAGRARRRLLRRRRGRRALGRREPAAERRGCRRGVRAPLPRLRCRARQRRRLSDAYPLRGGGLACTRGGHVRDPYRGDRQPDRPQRGSAARPRHLPVGCAVNRRVLAATAAVVLVAACSQRAPVTIASVSPTSGGPGARLTITGTGLAASATATVCGVGLVDLDVEVGQRKVGAPGTVGALPDTATLTGTVPDLGDSAECVVQVSGPGGPVAWSGRFAFQGKDGGRPVNQAPTTTGLPDLLIGGDETSRVIDLSAAFDDADDGVAALAFAATVTAPDGNVTADVSGT